MGIFNLNLFIYFFSFFSFFFGGLIFNNIGVYTKSHLLLANILDIFPSSPRPCRGLSGVHIMCTDDGWMDGWIFPSYSFVPLIVHMGLVLSGDL